MNHDVLNHDTANHRKDMDIIRRWVSTILQNRINSRIANNEDAKDLIDIINQI